MADTEAPKIVESTIEEKKVEEKEKVEKAAKEVEQENGDKAENGDSKEAPKETPEEKEETEEPTDKCCIKRKSTGDAIDGKTEEATPEKKAKVDSESPAEAEANGEVTEAEAAA